MATKPLKLNGKLLNLHPPSIIVSRIAEFLDKSPHDELFTTEELAKRVAIGSQRPTQNAKNPALAAYSLLTGRNRYWGNPKAIAALREQVGQ